MFAGTEDNSDRIGLHLCVNQASENDVVCKLLFYVCLGGQPREWNGLKQAPTLGLLRIHQLFA